MLKRMLHAANQVVVHEETYTGTRELTIPNTVNDAVDFLAVKGDSWQLVQEQGKNLFNIDGNINDVFSKLTSMDFSNPNTNNGDGSITLGSNSAHKAGAGYRIKNVSGKTYVFSCDVLDSGSGDGALLTVCIPSKINYVLYKATVGNKLSRKVTFDADIEEAIFSMITSNGTNAVIGNVQIEIGETATPYEPFQPAMPSPEYPSDIISVSGQMISTNNGLGGRDKFRESKITIPELRAIPGIDVRDELVVYKDGSGKIVRRVVAKYFSEFKTIVIDTTKEKTQVFWIMDNVPAPSREECLCTHLNNQAQGDIPVIKILPNYRGSIYIALNKTDASTLDELKTWIERNNPCVLYCAEPTEESITADQVQGILRTHQYYTEIGFEGLDEHLEPEIGATVKVLGR